MTTRSELYREAKTKGWTTPWNKSTKAILQKYLEEKKADEKKAEEKKQKIISYEKIVKKNNAIEKKQAKEKKKAEAIEKELIKVMPPELLGIIEEYTQLTSKEKRIIELEESVRKRQKDLLDFLKSI